MVTDASVGSIRTATASRNRSAVTVSSWARFFRKYRAKDFIDISYATPRKRCRVGLSLTRSAIFPFFEGLAFFNDDVIFSQLAGNNKILFRQQDGRFGCQLSDGNDPVIDDHRRQDLRWSSSMSSKRLSATNARAMASICC